MKRVIIFILLIFNLGVCFSQTVNINGSIISSSDGQPINNVNISVINSKQWTSSNNKGEFVLKDVKLPVILKVSHLAYLTQEISLSKNDIKKKNKINLDIMLVDKVSPLSEIVIREKPKNMLERLVYDFEVDSSSVYVINNSKDKKQLQTYSFDDYLKNMIFIPDECNEMKYDYSNNLSVKNKNNESYYKILFDGKRNIKLKKEKYDVIEKGILRIISDGNNYDARGTNIFYKGDFKSMRAYNIFNKNVYILNSFPDCKFFYNYGLVNKCFMLYKLDKYKGKLKYTLIYYALYDVDDWLKNNYFSTNLEIRNKHNSHIDSLYQIQNENTKIFAKVESIKKVLKIANEIDTRLKEPLFIKGQMVSPPGDLLILYYQLLNLQIPIYLAQMSNNLYIFNFEKMNLYKLSNKGMPLNIVKLDSLSFKNDFIYLKEILINNEQTHCFLRYDILNKTKLKEIDLETGKYVKTIDLTYSNVEKIRIVGNYIYYTARVEGFNGDERWLYKEKINDLLVNKDK